MPSLPGGRSRTTALYSQAYGSLPAIDSRARVAGGDSGCTGVRPGTSFGRRRRARWRLTPMPPGAFGGFISSVATVLAG